MLRCFPVCFLLLALASHAQMPQTLSLSPDSPRWELEGEAKAADYLGRKCLLLNGGAAVVKDFELRDGVIDVDVATPAKRGFFHPNPPSRNNERVSSRSST